MKRYIKWPLYIIGGFVGLIGIFLIVVYAVSGSRINTTYKAKSLLKQVSFEDEALINEGKRLYHARGCVDCHGDNLEGRVLVSNAVMGTLAGPNLTRGKGGIGKRTVQQIDLAVRHGINPKNKPLLFMPSSEYAGMNDQDIEALAAYIITHEPVDNAVPATAAGPVFRTIDVLGQGELVHASLIDHGAKKTNVAPAPTYEYGKRLAMGCTGCHGKNLQGGQVVGAPPGSPAALNITSSLRSGIGAWTYSDFEKAIRKGIAPGGRKLNEFMPWKGLSYMTDVEIQALWIYLKEVKPVENEF